ncbi:MAG TPA: hypothetical protein VD886_08315 [Herpetosiphonaceae bacterium]|nr:hypothetical protein [Herpetosiphonaceae bacterium]
MSLRSFLRPASRRVEPPPCLGDDAPALPVPQVSDDKPEIVTFLRHVGCPFAEATMRSYRELSLQNPDMEWVAVSQAEAAETGDWCSVLGGSGRVTFVNDPERALYAAWGLGLTPITHWMGWRTLKDLLALRKRGIRNRAAAGSRWQTAGSFAVDALGIVRWRHLPAYAGDLPDFAQALAAIREQQSHYRL